MLEKIFNIKNLATILILFFITAFTSFSILLIAPNYLLVFAVVVIPFIFVVVVNKPFLLLQILILILPFAEMKLLDVQIMGIPGLKVLNIIVVATFASFIFSKRVANFKILDNIFIIGMLSILLIAVIRSLPQIQVINDVLGQNYGYSRYFQIYFLKSILYFSPLIIISWYVSDSEKVVLLLRTFIFSIFILSIFLLVIYVFFTPNKMDFHSIRNSFTDVIHLHGNNIATIYLTSFPLLISYLYMKKNMFAILNVVLWVITIGLLYSRTAYMVVPLSVFMYLFISKRIKWTPVVICLLIVSIYFIPDSITKRALTGIESTNVEEISAGRVDNIWTPLIREVLESPMKLFFGNGRSAILYSDAIRDGHILEVRTAHNLYLNSILDIGVIGLTFFASFYLIFIKKIFNSISRNLYECKENEILFGVIASTLSFLIAGLTGRQLFPIVDNYPLWIILAIGFAILKIQTKKETV